MTYALVDDLSRPGNENRGPGASVAAPSPKTPTKKQAVAKTKRVPRSVYASVGKRALDLALIIAVAPIVLPVMAVIWLITVLDGGHAFFAQERVGKNGKTFRCWKIRTMVLNAETVLQDLIRQDKAVAREWAANQKLVNDPRITRWGKILRKTSLDELPQLWNVVKGDMSLVGPRPFTLDQRDLYDEVDDNAAYYELRPGLSGLWQVDCRNAGEFAGRVEFDNKYGEQMSFAQDLRIIWKTFAVILKGTGQ